MIKTRTLLASLLFVTAASFALQAPAQAPSSGWQTKLRQQLPLLGHRNWILIVDSAYPMQVSPGIEVIETNADQLTVIPTVLHALAVSHHVTANVYLDAELPYVPQQLFPRINDYRADLKKILETYRVQSLPHEELIAKVSEAGKDFRVLVLKTNMAMPYTSVFLQLDCRYWGPEDEQKLRQAMKSSTTK